jgi:hypothetical protein
MALALRRIEGEIAAQVPRVREVSQRHLFSFVISRQMLLAREFTHAACDQPHQTRHHQR